MDNAFLGWPDLVVLGAILALDVWIVASRRRIAVPIAVLGGALFLFVLPSVSMFLEIDRFAEAHRGQLTDGFERLYVFLRFPEYWILGLTQLGLFGWSRGMEPRRDPPHLAG